MSISQRIFSGITEPKEKLVLKKAAQIGHNLGIPKSEYAPEKLALSSKTTGLEILVRTSLMDACVSEGVAFKAQLRI